MKVTSNLSTSVVKAERTIEINPSDSSTNSPQQPNQSSSSLVSTKGTFSTFLAPLNKDTFREVVTGVEDKLKVVNQTLSMLTEVSDTGFEMILGEMLESISYKTGELLCADRTTIYLLDEDEDELVSIVAKGENGNNLEFRIPVGRGIAGEVAQLKKLINIPYDFYDDPRSTSAKVFDKKNDYRTYNMLVLPLLNDQEELVAVFQLINKLDKSPQDPQAPLAQRISRPGFNDLDIQLFQEFAPSIRLLLESSRSFYKATQRQRAANALMEATNSLSKSNLDLDATLKTVMDAAKQLMDADRSTLWLIDRDSLDLWTKIPQADGSLKEMRVPVGVGYAGKVAATGEPLNIGFDLYEHDDSANSKKFDQSTGYRTCSLLCMPVFNSDGDLIGVTQLINKKKQGEFPPYDPTHWPEAPVCWKASFNRSDQEFMEAFNIQAGVALQNAQLFAQVKQQEQMQRDMLRSLTNGVISTDKAGKVIAANEKAQELLGWNGAKPLEGQDMAHLIEIKGSNFADAFHAALKPTSDKDKEQYYPDRTLISVKEETEHSVNLSINSITDTNDATDVYGALVVMDDISDEKRLKSTMYRYMTQELAEKLLQSGDAKLGGDRKEVSVLFSDIRSYTTLTEKLEAEEVVSMLNDYFETMVEAIFENKGTLDKYIGDAIMAVFGSPVPMEDHAWSAVQTALDMRRRLTNFNQQRQSQGKPPIRIGIGIHSDSVISGNIGSSKRMEFTAIGDGVNLGSRLEGASKQYGCDIIISENTYQPCADKIIVRELDRTRVKGKTQPVSIYELVGYQSESIPVAKQQAIELYHRGREYYINRSFARALAQFSMVIEIDRLNKAAQLHIERCQHFLSNPPPQNWDGVWTLTSK